MGTFTEAAVASCDRVFKTIRLRNPQAREKALETRVDVCERNHDRLKLWLKIIAQLLLTFFLSGVKYAK